MKKTDLVLALDPGKEFYAWAVVRGDGTVIDTGMIKNLVNDFSYLHFGRQVALRKVVGQQWKEAVDYARANKVVYSL
jgi:hypothetical protein